MLWLWILLGVLLVVVVVPLLVGMLLPDEYEGRARVLLDAPPERVWEVLQDHQRHPVSGRMMRDILEAESDNGLPAWREDLGSTQLLVCTAVSEEPRRRVLEVKDQVAPMTARWDFELNPAEAGGSEIVVHNRTVIRSGTWRSPVFRLIMRSTHGAEKVLREYLREVAADLGVTARLVAPEA